MTRAFEQRLGLIVQINLQLFGTATCGAFAMWCWPETAHGWPWGMASVAMGFGTITAGTSAIKTMLRLYQRETALAEFTALGGDPKTAELVSTERLIKAGMVEP